MKDMFDSHEILNRKIRMRGNSAEFKDSSVDGVKVEVVTGVGATHETLKQSEIKIAKQNDLRDVPRSLETNSRVWEIERKWCLDG